MARPARRRGFSNPFSRIFGNDTGYVRQKNDAVVDFLFNLVDGIIGRARRNGQYSNPISRFLHEGMTFARSRGPIEFDWPVIIGVLVVIFACTGIITLSVLVGHPAREVAQQEQVVEQTPQMAAVANKAPEDQIRILLLGSDERGDGSYRTDVIMLVVLDPNDKSVKVVSFPRDLWVKVPSLWEMKINEVHESGGFDAMTEMMQENFGVRPQYYVMTNFAGFVEFIDNRGGIDVRVAQTLTDDCDLAWQKDGDCTVDPGVVHMDGPTALWYVRSRKTSSDIDRLRRAREVVSAVYKKVMNFSSLTKLGEFKAEVEDNVQTNISLEQAISLIPYGQHAMNEPKSVQTYSINEDYASEWVSWNGQWILQPDLKAIRQLFQQAGIQMAK